MLWGPAPAARPEPRQLSGAARPGNPAREGSLLAATKTEETHETKAEWIDLVALDPSGVFREPSAAAAAAASAAAASATAATAAARQEVFGQVGLWQPQRRRAVAARRGSDRRQQGMHGALVVQLVQPAVRQLADEHTCPCLA